MNKQELLDKAVHEFGGKWPLKTAETSVYSAATHKDFGISFTKEELQQRASELGYVNGYRYGIEYPTGGKKPDLPDDVIVEFKMPLCMAAFGVINKHALYLANNASFRIIDERYKPADTSYLETPALEPAPQEESWYDYDNQKAIALPPVGAECEWKPYAPCKADWKKCFVDYIHGEWVCVTNSNSHKMKQILNNVKFRPLDHNRKATEERRKVVNAAYTAYDNHTGSELERFYALYDAGYLKLPSE